MFCSWPVVGLIPIEGYTGRSPPREGHLFLKLAVYVPNGIGKIAISVYERVTKSAAK